MIDGFGWFTPSDYRRAWLGFDEVDYVLPEGSLGHLFYPPALLERSDVRSNRWRLPAEFRQEVIARARADARRPETREELSSVARADLQYSVQVVQEDPDLAEISSDEVDGKLALTLLAHKLIAYASVTDSVPIVGRQYAARFLARRARATEATSPARALPEALATVVPASSVLFVSDENLMAVALNDLVKFKSKRRDLLDRAQADLLEVAATWQAAEPGARAALLTKAQLDLAKQADTLRGALSEAWLSAGFPLSREKSTEVVTSAVMAAGGAGLGILLDLNWPQILGMSIVGAATTAASVVTKRWKLRRGSVAYFMDLADLAG